MYMHMSPYIYIYTYIYIYIYGERERERCQYKVNRRHRMEYLRKTKSIQERVEMRIKKLNSNTNRSNG